MVNSIAVPAGFMMMLVIFATIRKRLNQNDIPKAFQGNPIFHLCSNYGIAFCICWISIRAVLRIVVAALLAVVSLPLNVWLLRLNQKHQSPEGCGKTLKAECSACGITANVVSTSTH